MEYGVVLTECHSRRHHNGELGCDLRAINGDELAIVIGENFRHAWRLGRVCTHLDTVRHTLMLERPRWKKEIQQLIEMKV